MAGGNGRKKKRGRRMKRKPGGSSSSSPSSASASDNVSPQPVEEQGLVVSGRWQNYEFGWHNALFVGTKGSVDIMASVRDYQLLKTCFICAILYAAEQDIRRWLAIEEPDRQPHIYFDYDTYVAQYEAEVEALIGQVVSSFYRTREDRPRTALKIFLRDGVRAYSKSKEWPGAKIIKITDFLFHKDMIFEEFQNIIESGGSIIGGFPVSPEFQNLGPNDIYEFSPVGVKRKPIGAHMVQFIGTGTNAAGREFLVFLNSKKRFGKNGVGKVYFDQIYNGVYTLECRAPPPPPPSDNPDLIAGADGNDDTLGTSGAALDGNKSSFSGAPDGNEAQSSTAPTTSLSQVGKYNRYDDDPIASCTIKIDGWVPSTPALLAEDTRFEGPWKNKKLDAMGTVTRCFVPSTKMNDLYFTNILLKINDKLGGLNSKLPLEHRQMIPIVNKVLTLILGRDLSHGSSGLSDIPSSVWFSKTQHRRKHKQPISAPGPANSSGTMNTTGPIPSLASSSPSTTAISMPLMHHNAGVLSPSVVSGADATGTRESPTDQIVDMYHFLEDDWLGHKVDSFFSRDDSPGFRDARSHCMACTKGFTFREVYSAGASPKKLAFFHFSSDGKLLATGRHDMKLGRLPFDPAALRDCSEEVGMLFHSTSSNPNVPDWSTEGVISHAKTKDIQAMATCHKESAILYENRSLCKLLMGNGEAVKVLCQMMFGAEFCGLLVQNLATVRLQLSYYSSNPWSTNKTAMLSWMHKSWILELGMQTVNYARKVRELMKNPPVEGA